MDITKKQTLPVKKQAVEENKLASRLFRAQPKVDEGVYRGDDSERHLLNNSLVLPPIADSANKNIGNLFVDDGRDTATPGIVSPGSTLEGGSIKLHLGEQRIPRSESGLAAQFGGAFGGLKAQVGIRPSKAKE
jgi:hypothetical protein